MSKPSTCLKQVQSQNTIYKLRHAHSYQLFLVLRLQRTTKCLMSSSAHDLSALSNPHNSAQPAYSQPEHTITANCCPITWNVINIVIHYSSPFRSITPVLKSTQQNTITNQDLTIPWKLLANVFLEFPAHCPPAATEQASRCIISSSALGLSTLS